MIGKLFNGSTVIGSSTGKASSRVLHVRRGLPIDFGGAGTTLPCFAVPTHREIRRLVTLNVMQRVEHNHSRRNRHLVINQLAL